MDNTFITPYPPNQPDSLPVYRVTDYVDIVDDTVTKYVYDKDPYNQNDLREWMTKIFKDELDLPVPEGKAEPYFNYKSDIVRGYHIHPKLDGMRVYPSEISIIDDKSIYVDPYYALDQRNSIGYVGYKLENVGEIKIMSAQEAHKLLNTGHDMSWVSRQGEDHKVGEQRYSWTGVPISTIDLQWYYPTTAETDWQLNGEYLIPVWKFKSPDSYATINAVDGDLHAEWSPEGNPNFTPNEKFYELKDIKTRKWIINPDAPHTNVERGVDIHA